jgi:hypothetical protein
MNRTLASNARSASWVPLNPFIGLPLVASSLASLASVSWASRKSSCSTCSDPLGPLSCGLCSTASLFPAALAISSSVGFLPPPDKEKGGEPGGVPGFAAWLLPLAGTASRRSAITLYHDRKV